MDNIYDYIISQENYYKTTPIPIDDNWEWNMFEHVRKSFLYKNSKFNKGANDNTRPFKNIVRPILNVQYRTEGFDVKDIQPYVDDVEQDYKSLVIKKYFPQWAFRNKFDDFIDELVESYVDYGLALVKNVAGVKPEVVNLRRLAFVDQSDVLSAPICEKHYMSVPELLDQKWDLESTKRLIALAKSSKKSDDKTSREFKSSGLSLEIYELHGYLPANWYDDSLPEDEYFQQMHIVGMYRDEKDHKQGITLFKSKEKNPYKAIKRDDIQGRACGWGGVEELFDHQLWTNYSELRIKDMLDAAAVSVIETDDELFATRNNLAGRALSPNEVLVRAENTTVRRLDTSQPNITLFNNAVAIWEDKARTMGSASDSALAENPSSGTPFALERLITQEGRGLHEYRQGKISNFVVEVIKDWSLPAIVKEINQGKKFTEELTADELEYVINRVVKNLSNDKKKESLMKGKIMRDEEAELIEDITRQSILNRGSNQILESIKDEFKGIPISVKVNIKNKQKNLPEITDKLVNVFRQIIATPEVLQDPAMQKLFNQILEYSGLNPFDYVGLSKPVQRPQVTKTEPIKELANNTNTNEL